MLHCLPKKSHNCNYAGSLLWLKGIMVKREGESSNYHTDTHTEKI